MRCAARSIFSLNPSRSRLSIMTSVSSAKRQLLSSLSPLAIAARTSARLVRLLEPGGVKLAVKGLMIGVSVRSLMTIQSLRPKANNCKGLEIATSLAVERHNLWRNEVLIGEDSHEKPRARDNSGGGRYRHFIFDGHANPRRGYQAGRPNGRAGSSGCSLQQRCGLF